MEYRSGQTPQFGKIRDVRFDQGDIVFQPVRVVVGATGAVTPEATVADPAAPRARPADDRAAVEETLNEYRRAYEARDIERLVRVFPSIPNQAALAAAFDDAKEVLVGMSPPEVRIVSVTDATARTRIFQSFVPRVGTARAAPTRDVLFTLKKNGDRWVIANLR
jgi:ketosteroid isomerase-like protein